MRARAAALVATAAVAVGCDWTAFDDLQARAPVLVVGAPSGYGAPGDFGRIVFPLVPSAGGPAARYLVSAPSSPALAEIDLDAAGQPSGTAVNAAVLSEGGAFPITSMAAAFGSNEVFMGAPEPGGGRLYLVNVATPAAPSVALYDSSTTEDNLGIGVAVGNVTGAGPMPDLVVVSSGGVRVYPAGDAASPIELASSAACPLALEPGLVARARVNRAVVIGELLAGIGQQIAVGTPSPSGPGTVAILSATPSAVTCLFTLTATPERFGQALAIGDFNGHGRGDLLVGAPPRDAYVFFGPLTAATVPRQIMYTNSSGEFGAVVAARFSDAMAVDDVVVTDSSATVAGAEGAGAVLVFDQNALTMQLTAQQPAAGAAFGSSFAMLPFCPRGCPSNGSIVPLIGAGAQTFTYFLLQPADTDPRRR